MRTVAAGRRARIGLDDETVTVWFDGTSLVINEDSGIQVDGEGRTDRDTVADLLAARIEASDAILSGRVLAAGEPDAVAAMLHLIEIILDVSVRTPALQNLARDLVESLPPRPCTVLPRRVCWYPRASTETEMSLLHDLGLSGDEG